MTKLTTTCRYSKMTTTYDYSPGPAHVIARLELPARASASAAVPTVIDAATTATPAIAVAATASAAVVAVAAVTEVTAVTAVPAVPAVPAVEHYKSVQLKTCRAVCSLYPSPLRPATRDSAQSS